MKYNNNNINNNKIASAAVRCLPGLAKSVTDALNHGRNCTATAVFGLKNIREKKKKN